MDIRYDWTVYVTKPWMVVLAPLLRPVFAANHRWAMARGFEGLQRELRAFEPQPVPACATRCSLTLAIYLAAWWLLEPYGNHGLWGAFYVSYFARAGTLLWYYPALVRSVPA